MKLKTVVLAVVAATTLGSLAHAQSSPAMKEDTGSTVNSQGAPGVKAGQPANPTGAASTPAAPNTATTGSSQGPTGTNNPRTGTQAPDAQKGGSGSMGGR